MANVIPFDDRGRQAPPVIELADETGVFGNTKSTFDFRYIAAAIRSNLWLIAAIILAAIAISVVLTMLQTPRFTAATTVQINDTTGRVLSGDEDSNAVLGGGGYDTDRFLKTQIDVLKSRGLANRVSQRLKLTGNPRFYASQEVTPPVAGVAPEALRRQVAGMLMANVKVNLPRDSRIVTISYESTDPQMSAEVVNAYASEFIQSNLQRKYDSSAYARNFIAEQLSEAKQRVENSERALNAYARQAGLIRTRHASSAGKDGASGDSSVTTASLNQLNQAANQATAARIAAEGRWRAISSSPLLSSPEVVSNGAVSSLQAQKATVEADLNQLRAGHLDDYPAVQAKQAQLASLNRQLQAAAQQVRGSVYASYVAARNAEEQLTGQVNTLKGETLSEQDRNVQYGLLAREADTNRQVYDGLLQRFKELNASAGISLSNVSIIDTAEAPTAPSSPNLMKNLLVALIMGIGLAAITVFLKDQFDDSIRVPEDVEPKLGLPLLGVVPRSHDGAPDDALVDPKSPISEAYNSLRGSLLYSTSDGLPQVMLVTSAQASEGKTTSSYAIASGFARMGRRVVLIDADLRRPSLHRRIGYDNDRGLSTLLTSHDSLDSVLIPDRNEYLSLMPSGPIPPSPTELLSTPRIEEVLQEAAKRFDVVVVDSPPVLGLADAPLMSALVDGVVFVVEADRSRRGSLKTALRRLRAMRPILLGAVLTKFDPLKSGNRYSEYYGYDYYQYESKAEKAPAKA